MSDSNNTDDLWGLGTGQARSVSSSDVSTEDLWDLDARSLSRSLSESTPELDDGADAKSSSDFIGLELFDRFRIVSYLDGGALARVFRGIEINTGRPVAIKVLRKQDGLRFEIAKKRLIREAEFLQSIQHPNVVEVLGYGTTDDGTSLMVMELLEGYTLRTHLDAVGRFELSRATLVGSQLASALAAAHAQGGVHRDLKPANVFIQRDAHDRDQVKVVDFGLVTANQKQNQKEALTIAGFVMGTPVYMSPEQAMGEAVDGRSDIYSFGILLYEMLAGRAPFYGDNVAEILTSHIDKAPPTVMQTNPEADCPPAFEELIQKCLAKAPDHRPQDMTEVCRALAELSAGPTASVPSFEQAKTPDIIMPEEAEPSGPLMLPPPRNARTPVGAQDNLPTPFEEQTPQMTSEVGMDSMPGISTPSYTLQPRRPRYLYFAGVVMILGAAALILWSASGF